MAQDNGSSEVEDPRVAADLLHVQIGVVLEEMRSAAKTQDAKIREVLLLNAALLHAVENLGKAISGLAEMRENGGG